MTNSWRSWHLSLSQSRERFPTYWLSRFFATTPSSRSAHAASKNSWPWPSTWSPKWTTPRAVVLDLEEPRRIGERAVHERGEHEEPGARRHLPGRRLRGREPRAKRVELTRALA